MSLPTKTYLCEMKDCITTWVVRSQTDGSQYVVDLLEKEHACQCKWWKCEVAPKLREGKAPRKMCVHYNLALNAFTPLALEVFRRLDKNLLTKEQT